MVFIGGIDGCQSDVFRYLLVVLSGLIGWKFFLVVHRFVVVLLSSIWSSTFGCSLFDACTIRIEEMPKNLERISIYIRIDSGSSCSEARYIFAH